MIPGKRFCAEGALECGARGAAFDNSGVEKAIASGVADAAVQSFSLKSDKQIIDRNLLRQYT
jgi:hypothetical protein